MNHEEQLTEFDKDCMELDLQTAHLNSRLMWMRVGE